MLGVSISELSTTTGTSTVDVSFGSSEDASSEDGVSCSVSAELCSRV